MAGKDERSGENAGAYDADRFGGTPVFPPGTSEQHRRRLLQAMAGGSTVAVAGCLGLFDDEEEEAFFELSNLSPSTVEANAGEEIEVSVRVTNTGEEEGSQNLEFRFDGETETSRHMTLVGGEEDGASFTMTAPEELGEYEFGFYTEDDEATGTLTVAEEPEPALFAVALDVEAEVAYTGEMEVMGTVENTGEEAETQTVVLSVDGEEVDSLEVELDAGETAELAGMVDTDAPGGSHDALIESESDTDEMTVRVGAPDYTAIDHMVPHWVMKDLAKSLDMQFAYSEDEIWMRFQWDWDVPNGWFHDLLVYDEDSDEWSRYSGPNPGIADPDYGLGDIFEGFTEDRLAVMIDDGSVEGFEQFGGWLTIHEGTRTLPAAAPADEVEAHPHHGDFLENDDVRKYIPQSRGGEWWENDWDDVKDLSELEEMLENGEFIDMPMVRCHRGLPAGYATVHTILDHRHGALDPEVWGPVEAASTRVRSSIGLDDDGRPQYMFDPDLVENGALQLDEIYDGQITTDDIHAAIHRDPDRDEGAWPPDVEQTVVEFDPDVAEFDGAAVPRRHLFPDEVEGPGGLWKCRGGWVDGTWTIEMFKERETDFITEKDIEEGEIYTISPGVHGGGAQRWHWVCYPLKLAIGEDTEVPDEWESYDDLVDPGTAVMYAEEFDGDEPDWNDIQTYTTAMMYPGMTDWTWLVSGEHPREGEIRNAEINIWEHHDENPEDFAVRMVDLEQRMAPRR